MEGKSSSSMFLVAIVAVVAIVALVVLYMYVTVPSDGEYALEDGEFGLATGAAAAKKGAYERIASVRVAKQPRERIYNATTLYPDRLRGLKGETAGTPTPTETPPSKCSDRDGDGFQKQNDPAGCLLTTQPDCDDTAVAINPGAVDGCDSLDNDCNGIVDGKNAIYDACPKPCFDSDASIDIGRTLDIGGTTRGSLPVGTGETIFADGSLTDECVDKSTIKEAVCVRHRVRGSFVGHKTMACPAGTACVDPDGPGNNKPAECSSAGVTLCADADRDSYQNPSNPSGCTLTTKADCNDRDQNVRPGLTLDVCDGVDTNCDGMVDGMTRAGEFCPTCMDTDGNNPITPGSITITYYKSAIVLAKETKTYADSCSPTTGQYDERVCEPFYSGMWWKSVSGSCSDFGLSCVTQTSADGTVVGTHCG